MNIKIDSGKCIRCGACVRDCIVNVLKIKPGEVPQLPPDEERFCLNCQHCLAICPTGAVTCCDVSPEQCASIGKLPDPDKMLNLFRQRRSIRQYRDETLDSKILEKLRNVLAWTPTGCNDHRLFFIIIENKEDMNFFRSEVRRMLKLLIKTGIMRLIYPNYKRFLGEIMSGKDIVFRDAPHMIVAASPRNAPCKEADPWIALSYFDCYAQSLELGTCWCGFAVHAFRWNRKLRKRLNLPKGYSVDAVLLFGKPAVQYARSTMPQNFQIEK